MDLIDSHAHIDFPQFADDHEAMLQRARDAGVIPLRRRGQIYQRTFLEVERLALLSSVAEPEQFLPANAEPGQDRVHHSSLGK